MAIWEALGLGCDSRQHHSSLTSLPQLADEERWRKWLPPGNVRSTLELSTAYLFLPIAEETLGPMNDSAYEFFEIIGHKITDESGDSREVSFHFQRLSVIIQRFNAALFRDTFTLHDDPDL